MTVPASNNQLSNEAFLAERKDYEEFITHLGAECWDEIGGKKRPNKSFFRQLARRFGVDTIKVNEESEYVPCNPDVCPKVCPGGHYEARFTVRATRRSNGATMDGDGSCIDNEKWPLRTQRASKKQVNAVNAQMGKYDASNQARLLELATSGRCTGTQQLHPLEASALLDYFYGKTATLEAAAMTERNTRHNVRATAHTRAKNRAISDLIADGIVSAEELLHRPNADDENVPSKREQKAAASQPPAAVPKPAPVEPIKELQGKRIVKLAIDRGLCTEETGLQDNRLKQFVSDLLSGQKCRVEQLNTTEAGSLILALQKKTA